MIKKLFIILMICMFIAPTISLAEIKVLETKEFKVDKSLRGVSVSRVCIDGYEYTIVEYAHAGTVSIVQSFKISIVGFSLPKRCK